MRRGIALARKDARNTTKSTTMSLTYRAAGPKDTIADEKAVDTPTIRSVAGMNRWGGVSSANAAQMSRTRRATRSRVVRATRTTRAALRRKC